MSETTPSRDTITHHSGVDNDTPELRAQALKRLQDRRGLMAHTLAYLSVNILLVAVWVATGQGFFWPLFPLFGWGIGLAFHAWSVFWPEPDEAQVDREIERIRQTGGSAGPCAALRPGRSHPEQSTRPPEKKVLT